MSLGISCLSKTYFSLFQTFLKDMTNYVYLSILLTGKKCTVEKLRVLFYSVALKPGRQDAHIALRDLSKEVRKEPGYMSSRTKKTSHSQNIKRWQVIKNQTSQRKKVSIFLCRESHKSLGLLISFLWNASQLSWPISRAFSSWVSPRGAILEAIVVTEDLITDILLLPWTVSGSPLGGSVVTDGRDILHLLVWRVAFLMDNIFKHGHKIL